MIKAVKFFFLVLFVIGIPNIAFAQDPIDTLSTYQLGGIQITPSFTPSPTDLSVNYLGQIFGTVGNVLHGTSGQMLGQLFKVFNIGLLVLAGVFLVYTIAMTVLNTAHEGEFMGRKWNSAWIAIRTVLGLGLLVPSMTTGYSTIQVIVMWVVLQGVGFANMAWYSALYYIAQGGALYTPPATDTHTMINLAGTVLEMQVCMYSAQQVEQNAQKNQQQAQAQTQTTTPNTNTAAPTLPTQTYVQDFMPLFVVFKDPAKNGDYNSVVKFPGNKYQNDGDQDNACGQISFGHNPDQQTLENDQKATTLQAAIKQIMLDTDSYAKQIANPSQNGQNTNQNFPSQVESAIVGAAADWVNITLPIRSGGQSASENMMSDYVKNAILEGWIMSGRYYYSLGSIQRKVTAATTVSVNIDQPPAGFAPTSGGGYLNFTSLLPDKSKMNNLFDFSENDKKNLIVAELTTGTYVNAAVTIAKEVDQQSAGGINVSADADAGILTLLLTQMIIAIVTSVQTFMTATGDPILILQNIGWGFISAALYAWLAGTVGIFGLGIAASSLSSVQPVGYGVEDAAIIFAPTFTAFILTFMVLGLCFAFYIPLIPFIIFVFAAVGWLITVIEAMVAAPLVALGITHPEGHDLLGKSEQAIMLLLSVFLRPVLMVIGLIAGMILSRVVLRFLNTGFFGIIIEVGDINIFAFLGVLVVYCMLLISIINQTFGLIYVIPDRVMRWLGVSEQTSGVQEALQATKQGFDQVSGGIEKMGSSITSSSGDKFSKALARRRKKGEKEEEVHGAPKG